MISQSRKSLWPVLDKLLLYQPAKFPIDFLEERRNIFQSQLRSVFVPFQQSSLRYLFPDHHDKYFNERSSYKLLSVQFARQLVYYFKNSNSKSNIKILHSYVYHRPFKGHIKGRRQNRIHNKIESLNVNLVIACIVI